MREKICKLNNDGNSLKSEILEKGGLFCKWVQSTVGVVYNLVAVISPEIYIASAKIK